jgi:serine/threonine protein kinase
MFLDEARLAASLHHHNIVQVNDIGEEGGEFFFAMEYVHGEDARVLLVEANKRGEKIPVEHVIAIVTGAAAGLHHAHEQRGLDGTPLNIVHRDVSPANILVGYDGAVKVADFGIALAAHRAEQTQSGVLKGKVAYMSPEQCNCEPVDRRSDVFSLGIVLYELLTIRPCFAGDNDFMTMSAIVNGKVERPSMFNRDLPKPLEAIVMKALARDAKDRYQSADELRRALEEYAAKVGLRNSATGLADYMKTQFGSRALPWQDDEDEPEIEMSSGDATPTIEDDLAIPMAANVIVSKSLIAPQDPTVPLQRKQTQERYGGVVRQPRPPAQTARVRIPTLPKHRAIWLAGAIVAVVIAGVSLIAVSRGGKATVAPRASAAPVVKKQAPQPLERPSVAVEAAEATAAPVPAPTPTKKSSHRKRDKQDRAEAKADRAEPTKAEQKPADSKAAKKWDPDALFPK